MTNLTWVLSSCVLILAVIGVRAAFGKRMRPGLRYALWALVLLRLLYPGTLFSSPVSVRGAAEKTEVVQNMEAVHGFYSIEYMNGGVVEGYLRDSLLTDYPATVAEQVTPERFAHMETAIRVRDVLEPVWRAGVALTTAVFFAANLNLRRDLRRRRTLLPDTNCPLRVYSVENLSSSCLFGGAIYVAAETAADETRLRHVLAHEMSHYLNCDHIWAFLRCVALALHWYNPLVWWAAALARQDSELCADALALKRLGEDERENYGATLIELSARRAEKAPLLCTATTMTNGKQSLRERVAMIARRPRMTAAVVIAVLALTAGAALCAFAGAERKNAATAETGQTPQMSPAGTYASVEDYLDAVRAEMTSVTYYPADEAGGVSNGEVLANVLDTRVNYLEKDGELSGLAPDGTLELYSYLIETKLDATPITSAALAGGMYVTEDGWCDFSGQGGNSLVVLRCDDGSVDVLFDRPNNDDRGGLYYYEESAEEMLYDFYVKENGLDLPLYTTELTRAGGNSVPAHRADGDGWYVYIPVQAWSEASSGGTARWASAYGTGSTISVTFVTDEEREQLRQYAEGRREAYYPCGNAAGWLVVTQYDPSILVRSDMTGLEPSILDVMAGSFRVTTNASSQQAAESKTLPRFAYQGKDPCLAAVCDWIVKGGEQARYWEAEVTIPAPLIAEVDDSDPQDVRVWGNFWSYSYTPRGTTLFCVSGGEHPGLLHLRAADGGYEVYSEEMVGDGEAYAADMRRIFGTIRMLKLDALDGDKTRAQYISDYVLQNGLPFTQYQDYGWDPVHIPGTPETPDSAQHIRYVDSAGWSIDYDLREFSFHSFDENEAGLSGVGDLEGISIVFERCAGTTTETAAAMRTEQMEQPTQMVAALGGVPATLLRDGATRDEVIKDTYIIVLNETDILAVTVRNTHYAEYGDPVVPGAREALEKTLKTFRLTAQEP